MDCVDCGEKSCERCGFCHIFHCDSEQLCTNEIDKDRLWEVIIGEDENHYDIFVFNDINDLKKYAIEVLGFG